jgi:nicotinamide-nucleotide amidase
MSLKKLAAMVGEFCVKHNIKIVTAESCTGGGLSYWLTSIPGSSVWFERGFVTYSNASKTEMLGVDKAFIEQHGAVSEAVAVAMAQGALAHSHANLSIAITGIAGPDGGTADKPVGTVWMAWVDEVKFLTLCHQFTGTREEIRTEAIQKALEQCLNFK